MSSSRASIEVNALPQEAIRKPLKPSDAFSRFSAHHFSPSPSGIDSNLILLLHGLGDSDTGFFNLGKSLQRTLPQTAILTLQAPYKVPFLDNGAHWMWYPCFDQFGQLLTKPNSTQTVTHLINVLRHLIDDCGWLASWIHIFGFGQGATIALETLVSWTKYNHSDDAKHAHLASVVSISGEFISHPTLTNPASTPVLHIYRSKSDVPNHSDRWASHRKATTGLHLQRLGLEKEGQEQAMIRGSEWDMLYAISQMQEKGSGELEHFNYK
uniref:Alpha beta-hydrolase n=1 Tax=Melanopsichium pennsylvanicum 4 TaxID=1398559 RepID=A0A077R0X7_9BASI|nr:alpha beta-hydrolase [Melanopsichium pennsylvanicum 4]